MKKPHQTGLSSLPSLESPCDTNTIMSEFGDIEFPNMNSIANSSSGCNNNINSGQSYNSCDDNLNMNINMNMNNMNWVAAREAAAAAASLPSLSWPPSLLSPNLQMNSLLIKALQLGNYRPREATSTENYSFLPQGISNFGTDFISSNFQAASSSSKVLDSLHQQQQQQEQPFNLDSINW